MAQVCEFPTDSAAAVRPLPKSTLTGVLVVVVRLAHMQTHLVVMVEQIQAVEVVVVTML